VRPVRFIALQYYATLAAATALYIATVLISSIDRFAEPGS